MSKEKANIATRYEREIPEGYEARIDGNKVIIEKKESEDERIREYLIRLMRGKDQNVPMVQKAIAYLEKQKESKAVELDHDREQSLFISAEESLGISQEEYNKIVDECIFGEQKPAEWSEEDEKYLNLAINIVASDFGEKSPTVSWLKSRRPQPKQEWNEEDERIKDNLLSELFNLYVGAQIKESTYFKYKDWVKTIPRPISLTKEQKCAIRRATVIAENNGEEHLARVLNSVYNETNLAP